MKDAKTGRWRGAIRLGGRRYYARGATKTAVADKLRSLKRDYEQGLLAHSAQQTVSQWLDYWLEHFVSARRPGTQASYRQHVEHLRRALGHHRLRDLSPQHVHAALMALDLAPGTRGLCHSVLKTALSEALRLGVVGRNVAQGVRLPKREAGVGVALSESEAQILIEAAAQTRWQGVLLLSLCYGMRIGEVLGLQWSDVDDTLGVLHVRHSLSPSGRTLGPTKAGGKILPLLPVVARMLEAQRAAQAQARAELPSWTAGDLVFHSARGAGVCGQVLRRDYYALLESAGLPRVRLHDLRHTCASLLNAWGVDDKTRALILGHSRVETTVRVYTHVTVEQLRTALEPMERLLSAL